MRKLWRCKSMWPSNFSSTRSLAPSSVEASKTCPSLRDTDHLKSGSNKLAMKSTGLPDRTGSLRHASRISRILNHWGSAKLTVRRSRSPKASFSVALKISGMCAPAMKPNHGASTENARDLSMTGRCQALPSHSFPGTPLSTPISFWNHEKTPSTSHSTASAAPRFCLQLMIWPAAALNRLPTGRALRPGARRRGRWASPLPSAWTAALPPRLR